MALAWTPGTRPAGIFMTWAQIMRVPGLLDFMLESGVYSVISMKEIRGAGYDFYAALVDEAGIIGKIVVIGCQGPMIWVMTRTQKNLLRTYCTTPRFVPLPAYTPPVAAPTAA
jgi:hypothetical protein